MVAEEEHALNETTSFADKSEGERRKQTKSRPAPGSYYMSHLLAHFRLMRMSIKFLSRDRKAKGRAKVESEGGERRLRAKVEREG